MAVKDGSDIWLMAGGAVVNGLVTKDIQLTVDEIDVTTQDSGGRKEFLAGEDSEIINFEILYDESDTVSYGELKTYALAKTAITFIMGSGVKTTGGEIEYGSGIITSLGQTAAKNSAASVAGTIRITGGTTLATSTTTLA